MFPLGATHHGQVAVVVMTALAALQAAAPRTSAHARGLVVESRPVAAAAPSEPGQRWRLDPGEIGMRHLKEKLLSESPARQDSILKRLNNRGVEVGPHGARHACTIVYLHGFAGQGRDYLGQGQRLPWLFGARHAPGLRAVLPTGQRRRQPWGVCENTWYAYKSPHSNQVGDPETLRSTRRLLRQLVEAEVLRLGGAAERVFLGGLSQGCAVALDTYVRLAPKFGLGGFVGSVGFLPQDSLGFAGTTKAFETLITDEKQARRPVWIQCATDDDYEVPWKSLAERPLRRAQERLPGLSLRTVCGRGHSIDDWEEDFLNEFIEAHAADAYP